MRRSRRLGLLVSVSPAGRSIVVGAAVSGLWREVGPTAWVVLEEMLLCSTGGVDDCTAAVSVRALGASLGLAKDTVARALRRLQAAGIVTPVPARTPAGTFDAGAYSITVPHAVSFVQTHTSEPVDVSIHTCVTHTSVVPPRGRVARRDPAQLSFAVWD